MTDNADKVAEKLQAATPVPAAPDADGVDPHAVALSPDAEAHRKALQEDWGQYVAAVDITFGPALAYPKRAPVPASNVKRWQYDQQGLVEKVGTKAGQKLLEEAAAVTMSTVKAPGDD